LMDTFTSTIRNCTFLASAKIVSLSHNYSNK
jgi:hypothetical protein